MPALRQPADMPPSAFPPATLSPFRTRLLLWHAVASIHRHVGGDAVAQQHLARQRWKGWAGWGGARGPPAPARRSGPTAAGKLAATTAGGRAGGQAGGRAFTMLLTARSFDVEQTATFTPLSIASSAGSLRDDKPPVMLQPLPPFFSAPSCVAWMAATPACFPSCPRVLPPPCRPRASSPLSCPHPSLMRRFTPGRTGSAPVSMSCARSKGRWAVAQLIQSIMNQCMRA